MRGHIDRYACRGMAAIVFVSMLSASIGAEAADESPASEGPKTAWPDGSARHDFVMDEQTLAIKPVEAATDDRVGRDGRARCILVVPKRPAQATRGPGATSTGIISRRPRPSCWREGSIWRSSHPGRPGSGMPGSPS